jgi:hypothetical protein
MAEFIPGLQLAERFYREAVRPVLDEAFTDLRHSAALIGPGSEVLGYDDPMSADHHWGPRVLLFVSAQDYKAHKDAVRDTLAERLPTRFLGYPTNFTEPQEDGSMLLQEVASGPVNHRVDVVTLRGLFRALLGVEPSAEIAAAEWLSTPQHALRSIADGAVFHDDLGLESAREKFAWYPEDVWIYLLAAGWRRIAQEEAFVGRTGLLGDELGSRLVAGRLARDLMRQCFLIERTYAPYSKWFGRAFGELSCAAVLIPMLEQATAASTWKEREDALVDAYSQVARMHNDLGLTEPLPTEATPFHNRPFLVIHGDRFAEALCAKLQDLDLKRIAKQPLIGSIDQLSDSTDLGAAHWRRGLRALYDSD